MQEETLTFEEIQLLTERKTDPVYVPHEVMKAYFTMQHFLDDQHVAKV